MATKYSKFNFVYFMQKWMDSVPGQTFLNYAYSWGAAVVILGTLFKLTHLPGANAMLFIGMGTEVFVFFISAFDRPFDKSTIDMTLDNHLGEEESPSFIVAGGNSAEASATEQPAIASPSGAQPVISGGGAIIIGGGSSIGSSGTVSTPAAANDTESVGMAVTAGSQEMPAPHIVGAPAPAVSIETAEAMEAATSDYVERLNTLNETLEKVSALSQRLSVDSEEMENLNRTLTGIARVYEMQLKSASQQITTQDSINEQTNIMAQKIQELNSIYTRMIEAMTANVPGAAK